MSVYVIAQAKIENRGLLHEYVAKVIPIIESHRGRVVAFDEEPEVVEGPIEHPRTVILEFPSMRHSARGMTRRNTKKSSLCD